MDRIMKERRQNAVRELNRDNLSVDLWILFKRVFLICGGFVSLLIFTPGLMDWLDSLEPLTQAIATIIFCLSMALFIYYIRTKTK